MSPTLTGQLSVKQYNPCRPIHTILILSPILFLCPSLPHQTITNLESKQNTCFLLPSSPQVHLPHYFHLLHSNLYTPMEYNDGKCKPSLPAKLTFLNSKNSALGTTIFPIPSQEVLVTLTCGITQAVPTKSNLKCIIVCLKMRNVSTLTHLSKPKRFSPELSEQNPIARKKTE